MKLEDVFVGMKVRTNYGWVGYVAHILNRIHVPINGCAKKFWEASELEPVFEVGSRVEVVTKDYGAGCDFDKFDRYGERGTMGSLWGNGCYWITFDDGGRKLLHYSHLKLLPPEEKKFQRDCSKCKMKFNGDFCPKCTADYSSNPQPKFEVGDEVKITLKGKWYHAHKGIISGINVRMKDHYFVDILGGRDIIKKGMNIHSDNLELVEKAKREERIEFSDKLFNTPLPRLIGMPFGANNIKYKKPKHKKKGIMMRLTKTVKKYLEPKKAKIMEAFLTECGQIDVCNERFVEWFLEKFGDDDRLVELAEEEIKEREDND